MSGAEDLEARVGEHVTLRGSARNGAAGALVRQDDCPVYVLGLEEWPDDLVGETVEVSGTLVFRPRHPDGGRTVHTLDDSYALDDATWASA